MADSIHLNKKGVEKVASNIRLAVLQAELEEARALIAQLQTEAVENAALVERLKAALLYALDDMEATLICHSSSCPKDAGVLPPRCYEPCNCGRDEEIQPIRKALNQSTPQGFGKAVFGILEAAVDHYRFAIPKSPSLARAIATLTPEYKTWLGVE